MTLLGRVGIDPQVRGSESNPVVIFSLATNQRFKPRNSDEHQVKTEWHNIAVFRPYLRESINANVSKVNTENVEKGMVQFYQGFFLILGHEGTRTRQNYVWHS